MKYIEIVQNVTKSKGKKTKVFSVFNKASGDFLGEVKWFGRWRQYAFHPESNTVFEKVCLRDLATFCEATTSQHSHDKAFESLVNG